MGNTIGIDFGQRNCIAAFKFVQVEVVTDESGKSLLPSVVAWENGKIVVGDRACRNADSENVITSIRSIIGRGFNDPFVQQQIQYLGCKIKAPSQGTEDSWVVILGGKEYEPEDIVAEIFKQLVKNAQAYQEGQGQRQQITEAVITIPAYFNDLQRYATQNAAKRAGLVVKELLSEPTAAAISYGFKPGSDDVTTILVYDFGGGTFDSTVIIAAGDWFEELGKAGDLWLGGNDIDNKLIKLIKQKVAEEEDLDDIDSLILKMPYIQRSRLLSELKLEVRQAKIDLSTASQVKICPSSPLIDEFGVNIFIDIVITRSEFDQFILPLVERTIKICQQAIRDSDETEDSIDVVLMVGGSSQIPIVQQKLKEVFGKDKVIVHPRPMYAIAEGAAIVAAGLPEKCLTVSRNYCIQLADDPRFVLIKKGEDLPLKKAITIKTEIDGKRFMLLKFFSPDEVRNELESGFCDETIGVIRLGWNKYYPKETEIILLMEVDGQNEAVRMTAHLRNDDSAKVSCSLGRGSEDDAIAKEVEALIDQLNQEGGFTIEEHEQVNQLAGEIIQTTNSMISDNGCILVDQKRVAYEKLKQLKALTSENYNFKYNTMSNNPYDILEVSPAASQEEIREAFSMARNTKKHSSKAVKEARKKLLNNEERLIADYLLPTLPPILRFKRSDLSGLEQPEPKLKLIEQLEHDDLDNFYARVMADFNESITDLL